MFEGYVIKDRVSGQYLVKCNENDLGWHVANPLLAHMHETLDKCNKYVRMFKKSVDKYYAGKYDFVAVRVVLSCVEEQEDVDVKVVRGYAIRMRYDAKGSVREELLIQRSSVGESIKHHGVNYLFEDGRSGYVFKVYKTIEGAERVCRMIEEYHDLYKKKTGGNYYYDTAIFDVIPYSR